MEARTQGGNIGSWVREGVILFIAFLEALFDIQRVKSLVIVIGQPVGEDEVLAGGTALAIVLNNEQKVANSVAGKDADGQVVPVTDLAVDVIDAGTPPIFTVEVDGPASFVVHSVEPANPGDVTTGTGQIRVSAGGFSTDIDVVVETSAISEISVTSSTPEPEA